MLDRFKGTAGNWWNSEIMNFSDTLISYINSDDKDVAQLRGCTTGDEVEALANAKLLASSKKLLKVAIDRLEDLNGLRTQDRLNENGIKEHDELIELINFILD